MLYRIGWREWKDYWYKISSLGQMRNDRKSKEISTDRRPTILVKQVPPYYKFHEEVTYPIEKGLIESGMVIKETEENHVMNIGKNQVIDHSLNTCGIDPSSMMQQIQKEDGHVKESLGTLGLPTEHFQDKEERSTMSESSLPSQLTKRKEKNAKKGKGFKR